MKRSIFWALVSIVVLSSCATRHGYRFAGVPFNPENPKVYVLDGKQIVVDQEPIYITRKGAVIVWELPKDQKLTFPADGIVIRAERGDFACRVEEGATRYACRWENAKPRVFYKYTIKVLQDGKELPPLDPFLFADF